ncbi:MAG TPA: S1C family serine protease [Phycisphaerae bacterium]|nr:S1C family serine protease [Phycisphaerae bacterium]
MKQTNIKCANYGSVPHRRQADFWRRASSVFIALWTISFLPLSTYAQQSEVSLPDQNTVAAIEHGVNDYQQFIARSVVRVDLDANPVHLLPQNLQSGFVAWEKQWVLEHRLPPTTASSNSGSIIIMPEVFQPTSGSPPPPPPPPPPPNTSQQQQLSDIQNNPRRQLQLIRIYLLQNHAANQPNLWPVLRDVNRLIQASQNGLPSQTTGLVVSNQGRVLVLTSIGIPNDGSPVNVQTPDGKQVSATVLGINDTQDLAVLQLPSNVNLPGIEPTSTVRNGPMMIAVDPAVGNLRFINTSTARPRPRPAEMSFAADLIRTPQFILNMQGQLVAVSTSSHLVIGAASWSDLFNFVNTGKVEQRRFGIRYVSITPDSPLRRQFPQLGTQAAVQVQGVLPRSPAQLVGIRPGDIIVQVDGISIAQLQTWLNRVHDDPQNVQIGILRQGEPLTLSLDLTGKTKPGGP